MTPASALNTATRWTRADLANSLIGHLSHGKKKAAEAELARECGLEPATLTWERSVAKAWPYHSRVADVSITHHAKLMGKPMDMATKREWLFIAADAGWSANELEAAVMEDMGNRPMSVSSYGNARDWFKTLGIRFQSQEAGRKLVFQAKDSTLMVEVATRGDGIELTHTITEG